MEINVIKEEQKIEISEIIGEIHYRVCNGMSVYIEYYDTKNQEDSILIIEFDENEENLIFYLQSLRPIIYRIPKLMLTPTGFLDILSEHFYIGKISFYSICELELTVKRM